MLLRNGKEEKARIKVEHVIRDDFMMEANELIELLCETVVARLVGIQNFNSINAWIFLPKLKLYNCQTRMLCVTCSL